MAVPWSVWEGVSAFYIKTPDSHLRISGFAGGRENARMVGFRARSCTAERPDLDETEA